MALENAAIWEAQTGQNGTEAAATATNTVLFNPSPVLSTGGYVFETEFTFRNSTPENEAVASNNNEVQDMGLDGLDVQITGIIYNAGNDVATNSVNKLIKWMNDGKTTTDFEEGRFGLRMDDFPQLNVTPDISPNTFGYVLADVRFVRDGEHTNKVQFIANLRLSGDITTALGVTVT